MVDSLLFSLSFAFLAGVSSLLHPCSFALIPGYIAYLVDSKSLTHGILSGLTFTAGLISVLAILGSLISFVGGILATVLPWLQLIVALAIIFLGLIQMAGLTFDSIAPRFKVKRGFIGLYVFGLAFGLVISGCSAPVFFSIILYSFISGIQNGILTLISYGLGMGIITMAVSVLTLRTKQTILNKINRYSNWINRITGIILIAAGFYILHNALSLI
ncbi:MAG: cytochrome c biogenesis CcdA family protein [Candidatus Bathyarchaeia archaeon]